MLTDIFSLRIIGFPSASRIRVGSGGIGALESRVVERSKQLEGIIWKLSQFPLLLRAIYLSLPNAPHGRDPQGFLDELWSCSDAHEPHLCISIGDFNSRVGDLDDTAERSVTLPERQIVDHTTHAHGNRFLSYLNDTGKCIVNIRVTSHLNAFPTVSVANLWGKSVVDCVTPIYDCLGYFKEVCVTPLSEFLNQNNFTPIIKATGSLGSHAIILSKISVSDFLVHNKENNTLDQDSGTNLSAEYGVTKESRTKYR